MNLTWLGGADPAAIPVELLDGRPIGFGMVATQVRLVASRQCGRGFHAATVETILAAEAYPPERIARVQAIIRKQGLGTDEEVQAFEDALCLVFIETQFGALAERLEREKIVDVTRKTLKKMSPAAIEQARGLELDATDVAVIEEAAAG